MNNALKGALLSGLIFPGLGQIVLKHNKRGAAIIMTVLISLSVAVIIATKHALAILEKLESGGGELSMDNISNAALQASSFSGSLMLNLALLLVMLCWMIGTVDAYIIGKKKDMEERLPG